MEVGLSKEAWLSTFLALPNGIQVRDTFRRVLERIDAKQFAQCFEQWIKTTGRGFGHWGDCD